MKHYLIGVFCLLVNTVLVAGEDTALTLVSKNFNEKFNSNVPVSGRVVSGVMQASPSKLSALKINLAKLNSNVICLKVQSRDGTYFSSNEYNVVNNENTGLITPEYPTQYEDILSSFTENELGVLAYEGKCSDRKLKNVLLASRGNNIENDEVVIFVSSGRSDVFFTTKTSTGKKKTIKCSRIEEGKRTAYDTECKVNRDLLPLSVNEISILRRKSGRMLPSIKFNLVYADS